MARRQNPILDEGPSQDDLRRFSDDTAHCPECGAQIWDQADICPKCYSYLAGQTSSRHPLTRTFHRKWVIIVAVTAMVAFLLLLLPGGGQLLRVIFSSAP